MKRIQRQWDLLGRLCVAAGLAFSFLGVAHSAEPNSESDVQNIGFMKNPPQELRTTFPMCEEFLHVQWLDKKYMVGYSMYDVYIRKPASALPVRKRFHAIVAIPFGVPGAINYDAYEYAGKGRLKELFDLIKSADNLAAGFLALSAWKGSDRVDFHLNTSILGEGEIKPVLSDHRKTVCIVYPAGDRVWIIEGKTAERTYSEDQVLRLFNNVQAQGIETAFSVFKQMWILDVNGDGIDDYFMPKSLIYSTKGGLKKTSQKFERSNFIYSFPDTNQACVVDSNKMNFALTTDGKNYFAAGCNWTKLSSVK